MRFPLTSTRLKLRTITDRKLPAKAYDDMNTVDYSHNHYRYFGLGEGRD
jgi:hypothetical protein